MIEWNKYFDHIYCIHCATYIERRDHLLQELKRVGISGDMLTIFNSDTSKQFKDVYKNIRGSNGETFERFSRFSVAYSHYQVVNIGIDSGYKKILILEDDVRFLKDIDAIRKILEKIPNEYGIILFDKFTTRYSEYKEIVKGDCEYVKINGQYTPFWSAACYALNINAMLSIRDSFDKNIKIMDSVWNIGFPDYSTMNNKFDKYIVKTNIAIQGNYNTANFSPWKNLSKDYIGMGIDVNNYNLL